MLAQTVVQHDRQLSRTYNMLRGDPRPLERAGIDCFQWLVFKPLRQPFGLAEAGLAERRVLPALYAAFAIPCRFAMADEDQPGVTGHVSLWDSVRARS